MPKRKKIKLDGQSNYLELLENTVRQLDALIYDIEAQTTQNVAGETLSTEFLFDCVPILRKLKDARSFAKESLLVYDQS